MNFTTKFEVGDEVIHDNKLMKITQITLFYPVYGIRYYLWYGEERPRDISEEKLLEENK